MNATAARKTTFNNTEWFVSIPRIADGSCDCYARKLPDGRVAVAYDSPAYGWHEATDDDNSGAARVAIAAAVAV